MHVAGTLPDSVSSATTYDENGLAWIPLDEGAFLATPMASTEISQTLYGLDDDGNPHGAENRKNDEDDVVTLERKMQSAGMPSIVWKHAQRELRRFRKMQPQQPGYSSSQGYLELLADLPWQIGSEEHKIDLRAAKERLDRAYFGLGKVKSRIIEYLAVRKLKPDAKGLVLCFIGPLGVGRTSLALPSLYLGLSMTEV